jgi:hypothetical protein
MAQTDLAIRRLADLLPEQMVRALLGARNVTTIHSEPTEHKLFERRADSVVRATLGETETICHLEFQASHDTAVPLRVLTYHGLLRLRFHPLPVRSVVVYLMHRPPSGRHFGHMGGAVRSLEPPRSRRALAGAIPHDGSTTLECCIQRGDGSSWLGMQHRMLHSAGGWIILARNAALDAAFSGGMNHPGSECSTGWKDRPWTSA